MDVIATQDCFVDPEGVAEIVAEGEESESRREKEKTTKRREVLEGFEEDISSEHGANMYKV